MSGLERSEYGRERGHVDGLGTGGNEGVMMTPEHATTMIAEEDGMAVAMEAETPPDARSSPSSSKRMRERSSSTRQRERLGALEFCTALNGDDPELALRRLNTFVKIVRRERRQALVDPLVRNDDDDVDGDGDEDDQDGDAGSSSSSDREDDEDEDEDDDDESSSPRKKKSRRSHEHSWMEDTMNYDVPFVGTSTPIGSYGKVVPHKWPTGLLEEYLKVSPRASELIGDGNECALLPIVGAFHRELLRGGKRHEDERLSRKLEMAHVRAVGEVLTAYVPRGVLLEGYHFAADEEAEEGEGDGRNEEGMRRFFISSVLRHLVPRAFLNLAASSSTSKSRHHGAGGSRHKNQDRDGKRFQPRLASAQLRMLSYLSLSSPGAAREVSRHLSNLQDGIVRRALVPPKTTSDNEGGGPSDKSRSATARLRARWMELARAMVECGDGVVASSVSAPPPNKSPPSRGRGDGGGIGAGGSGAGGAGGGGGLVYLALRVGLEGVGGGGVGSGTSSRQSRRYDMTVSGLLGAVTDRWILRSGEGGGGGGRSSSSAPSNRVMVDLLGGVALERIARLTSYARPVLSSSVTYDTVISGTETAFDGREGVPTAIPDAAVRARRLAFVLLADGSRSPFLVDIARRRRERELGGRHRGTDGLLQQLARALLTVTSHRWDLSTRGFVLRCLTTTPGLLAPYLRSFPPIVEHQSPSSTSPSSNDNSFDRIAHYSFLSNVLRLSPPVRECFEGGGDGWKRDLEGVLVALSLEEDEDEAASAAHSSIVDALVACVVPSNLTKHTLSRALGGARQQQKSSQSGTPLLLVVEALKLLASILERARDCFRELESLSKTALVGREEETPVVTAVSVAHSVALRSSFAEALRRRIPDVQALLQLRSRFDPFPAASRDALSLGGSASTFAVDDQESSPSCAVASEETRKRDSMINVVLTFHIHCIIGLYKDCVPQVLFASKFDWTKVLPDHADSFLAAPPTVQLRVLRTLYELAMERRGRQDMGKTKPDAGTRNSAVRFSAKSCGILLMIRSKSDQQPIRDASRRVLVLAILRLTDGGGDNVAEDEDRRRCVEHEASVWLDGVLTHDCIASFEKAFDRCQKRPLLHALSIAEAWADLHAGSRRLPSLCFSPILTASLDLVLSTPLSNEATSSSFVSLVVHVATASIVYQRDPLPLAALIVYKTKTAVANAFTDDSNTDNALSLEHGLSSQLRDLSRYCQAIIDFNLGSRGANRADDVDRCWANLSRHILSDLKKQEEDNMSSYHNRELRALLYRGRESCMSNSSYLNSPSSSGSNDSDFRMSLMAALVSSEATWKLASVRHSLHHLLLTTNSGSQHDVESSSITSSQPRLYLILRVALMVAIQNEEIQSIAIQSLYKYSFFAEMYRPEQCVVLLVALFALASRRKMSSKRCLQHYEAIHKIVSDITSPLIKCIESSDAMSIFCTSSESQITLGILFAVVAGHAFPDGCRFILFTALAKKASTIEDLQESNQLHRWLLLLLLNMLPNEDSVDHINLDELNMTSVSSIFSVDSASASASLCTCLRSALRLWMKMRASLVRKENCYSDHGKQRLAFNVCRRLEYSLSAVFEGALRDPIASSIIALEAIEIGRDPLVRVCMSHLMLTSDACSTLVNQPSDPTSSEKDAVVNDQAFPLLAALVSYDCNLFAPPLLQYINHHSLNTGTPSPLRRSELNEILGRLMEPPRQLDRIAELVQSPSYTAASTRIVEYGVLLLENAANLLEETMESSDETHAFRSVEKLAGGVPVLLKVPSILPSFRAIVLDRLEAMVGRIDDKKVQRHLTSQVIRIIVKVATSMVATLQVSAEDDSAEEFAARNAMVKLKSTLFVRLMALLPKSLRNRRHHKQKTCYPLGPVFVMENLLSILQNDYPFDDRLVASSSDTIQRAIFTCMKRGISTDSESCLVSASCLRCVHDVVVRASSSPHTLSILCVEGILDVEQMHAMIVSHSEFSSVLSRSSVENGDETIHASGVSSPAMSNTKIELLRLMLCCVSLAPIHVACDQPTLVALLAGYNAGLTPEDCYIRRLLYLYEKKRIMDGKDGYFIDELQWGSSAQRSPANAWSRKKDVDICTGDDKRWDWFITALDIQRVRASLCQFPVWEPLVPPPDLGVEVWLKSEQDCGVDFSDTAEGAFDDDGNVSSSSSATVDIEDGQNESRCSHHAKSNDKRLRNFSTCQRDRNWEGSGRDIRYNPAFLLPVLFSLLEESFSSCPTSLGKVASVPKLVNREALSGDSFTSVSRRLCSNGGLALCLAGLSCKCVTLRKVSIGALALFLKSMRSEDSQISSEWKERSQLAMLLDSVQRGLTIMRVRQLMQQKKDKRDGTKSDLAVPMLPVVCALFLARAALILSQPGDLMYGPVNSYFLRLAENHGAYKDTSRLPAFIGLFCSTDDPYGHARKERLWALHLLKDGMQDGFCYKLALRRHVPALLLGTFDSYESCPTRTGNETERVMLLGAIKSMLRYGGSLAATHLICRLGLLPWIRGILVGRPFRISLPTLPLRLALVSLITMALDIAKDVFSEEDKVTCDVAIDAAYIAGPVMDLYDDTIRSMPGEGHWMKDKIAKITIAICRCLWALRCALHDVEDVTHTFGTSGLLGGIELHAAVKLLAHDLVDGHMKLRAAWALSSLPYRAFDEKTAVATQYCVVVLNALLGIKDEDGYLAMPCILRRVADLSSSAHDTVQGKKQVISMVLETRRQSVLVDGGDAMFKMCLLRLLDGISGIEEVGDVVFATARCLVQRNLH